MFMAVGLKRRGRKCLTTLLAQIQFLLCGDVYVKTVCVLTVSLGSKFCNSDSQQSATHDDFIVVVLFEYRVLISVVKTLGLTLIGCT